MHISFQHGLLVLISLHLMTKSESNGKAVNWKESAVAALSTVFHTGCQRQHWNRRFQKEQEVGADPSVVPLQVHAQL